MSYLIRLVFCVLSMWPTVIYAQWANEPAGFQVTLDCPFNSKPTPSRDPAGCGIENFYNAGSIASDSSAPVSPTSTFKSSLAAGDKTGGSQLNYVTSQVYREMYVGMMWRTNPQFQGRTALDKLFFMRGPASNGVFGMYGGATKGGTPNIAFVHNSGNVNNSHACALDLGLACYSNVGSGFVVAGSYHKLEAYIKSSTSNTSRDGIVRWWVNGAPAGNYTNLNVASAGLNEWVWSETWDACGGNPVCDLGVVNTQEWAHFIDHLRISVPGAGGGGDNPPGPPGTVTLSGTVQ